MKTDTPTYAMLADMRDRRLVSGLSDYEKSRLLHHLLQKREWDGRNGRPWDEYLHGQAEREIQMLISR
jgi:hypothetical protein